MPRTVLLLLSQLPQDPAGGAVRSLRTMCEMLAAAAGGEFRIAALGTTATDQRTGLDARALLTKQGVSAHEEQPRDARPVLRFVQRGIEYTILDTGTLRSEEWHAPHGRQFDALLDTLLKRLRPDVVLTMGATIFERARHRRCREAGAAVVLGVRQHGYYDIRAFEHVDDALMCSEYLVSCYEKRIGYRGTAIPPPLDEADVVPETRDPVFFTFVNPSPEKGVMLFARLAEEVSVRRPDIPFMVVESRGVGGMVVKAGMTGGFDLRRHKNIMVSPGVAQPKHFLAATRALLAPSVWDEPFGRVASEALLSGIPPIVSDRGGLPEACAGAGFVLALPASLTVSSRAPVSAEEARPWVDLVIRLADDQAFYQEACARAYEAGRVYRGDALAAQHIEYFRTIRRRPG